MFGLIFFLVLYNVFFCIFSYFIERFIAQKYLQNTYSREVISKGILRANILSYTVFFFLTYVIFLLFWRNVTAFQHFGYILGRIFGYILIGYILI